MECVSLSTVNVGSSRGAGHGALMGDERGAFRVWVVRSAGKRLLGRHRRRGIMILKWVFKKWDEEAWTELL